MNLLFHCFLPDRHSAESAVAGVIFFFESTCPFLPGGGWSGGLSIRDRFADPLRTSCCKPAAPLLSDGWPSCLPAPDRKPSEGFFCGCGCRESGSAPRSRFSQGRWWLCELSAWQKNSDGINPAGSAPRQFPRRDTGPAWPYRTGRSGLLSIGEMRDFSRQGRGRLVFRCGGW